MEFQTFLKTLESHTGKNAKKSGAGYMACCPAHDDENPSLSLREACDGKTLLHCFAGCPVSSICNSVGVEMSDLFEADFIIKKVPERIIYSYKDEQGKELYRKIRLQPGNNGQDKSFYFERISENGQILQKLQGSRKVLYRLPEIIQGISGGNIIFLVEGEKDADTLAGHGLIATTSSESLKWIDEFTETLEDADVVILYDMDKTGFERRDLLCHSLYEKVKRLRVVDLPGLVYQESHGSDISDWLKMGNTISKFLDIVEKTPDYTTQIDRKKLHVVGIGKFIDMNLPKHEAILSPILLTQSLTMIYAKRGIGKTYIALEIAYAVASGGSCFKWQALKPRKVLYIDGEMPGFAMQERLKKIVNAKQIKVPSDEFFRLVTPDLQENLMPDLSTKEGRALIDVYAEDSDLIIIDNLSCLFRMGDENEAASWVPAQNWLLDLRRKGKAVLLIHHAGKNGAQRGTSKKEDMLDVVISLKHPSNYSFNQGARFEIIFEKARHFYGKDAESFHVQLRTDEAEVTHWDIIQAPVDPEVEIVVDALKKGLTIHEIMDETGLSKSQVETRKEKAKKLGLIE